MFSLADLTAAVLKTPGALPGVSEYHLSVAQLLHAEGWTLNRCARAVCVLQANNAFLAGTPNVEDYATQEAREGHFLRIAAGFGFGQRQAHTIRQALRQANTQRQRQKYDTFAQRVFEQALATHPVYDFNLRASAEEEPHNSSCKNCNHVAPPQVEEAFLTCVLCAKPVLYDQAVHFGNSPDQYDSDCPPGAGPAHRACKEAEEPTQPAKVLPKPKTYKPRLYRVVTHYPTTLTTVLELLRAEGWTLNSCAQERQRLRNARKKGLQE